MLFRRASFVGVLAVLALLAGVNRTAAPDTATASTTFVAGTLNLQATLGMASRDAVCPAGIPLSAAATLVPRKGRSPGSAG